MNIIPAIDIKNGKVVKAVKGNRDSYVPIRNDSGFSSDPFKFIRKMTEIYHPSIYYIADIDSLTSKTDNIDLIKDIASENKYINFWVDIGGKIDHRLIKKNIIPILCSESCSSIKNINYMYKDYIHSYDYFLPICPETDLVLYDYIKEINPYVYNMKVSSPEALLVTSDKMLLKGICNQYNISHADSYNIKSNPDVYIIKDRFGCGCNNVKITNNKNLKVPSNRVYEKYVTGESYSVSLYISGSNYEMISINQQVIKLYKNNLKLKAINVNIYPIFRNSLFKFIDDILIAIPGLEGFIGFDFICNNKELFLIDINPRFTTSMSAINTCKGNHILDYINESIYEQTGISCKINL